MSKPICLRLCDEKDKSRRLQMQIDGGGKLTNRRPTSDLYHLSLSLSVYQSYALSRTQVNRNTNHIFR